jgi:hypothetical protein
VAHFSAESVAHFDRNTQDWPDIDNINPVKDDLLTGKLEQTLDEDFANGQAKTRIVMFPWSGGWWDMDGLKEWQRPLPWASYMTWSVCT